MDPCIPTAVPTSLPTVLPPGLNCPGLAPPEGVIPNFVDPPSLETVQVAATVVCLALVLLTTVLRMYTKVFIIKAVGWEDYTCCLALLGFIPFVGIGFANIKNGTGKHQWDVSIQYLIPFGKLGNDIEILYPVIIFMIKYSILWQYVTFFIPNHRSTQYWLVQSLIAINFIFYVLSLFITIFQCTPREKIWNPFVSGHCVDFNLYIVLTAVYNLVSDMVILGLPIIWILRLQMSGTRRLGFLAVFAIGIFAVAITAVRLVWSIRTNSSHDSTYSLTIVALCTLGEITAGILCSNLPTMPRFFVYLGPKVKSLITGSYRSSSKGISKRSGSSSEPRNTWTYRQKLENMRSPSNRNYLDLEGRDERHEFKTTVRGGIGASGSLSSAEEGLVYDGADHENSNSQIEIKTTTRVDQSSTT